MPPEALTVTEISHQVKDLLEDHFQGVWVAGEIGTCRRPGSGHLYLNLKDDGANLRAVMFRYAASSLSFRPKEGDEVLAYGTLTLYPARGDYQLRVTKLVPRGQGKLQAEFARLRAKLEAEGLFAPERKRPLPPLPRRIALVTSPTGAAVHDMIRVLWRRFPSLDIVVVPTRVQGAGAAEEIAAALDRAGRIPDLDLILAGRGGGSLEDLWAFNEEVVARALFASQVPVISAVGHEVDTTIADLVADLRAPTPSAAAELAVPEQGMLSRRVSECFMRIRTAMDRRLERDHARFEAVSDRRTLADPLAMLDPKSQRVDDLSERLVAGLQRQLSRGKERLEAASGRLNAVGPQRVLDRGFALLTKSGQREAIREAKELETGDTLEARLGRGTVVCEVTEVLPDGPGASPKASKPKKAARKPKRSRSKPVPSRVKAVTNAQGMASTETTRQGRLFAETADEEGADP